MLKKKLVNKLLTYISYSFKIKLLTSLQYLEKMNKPVGGRGHTAPYETTHARIPVPLKPKIDQLVDEYRRFVLEGKQSETDKYQVPKAMTLTTLGEAVGIAQSILKQKKSAKQSLEKLLTALYEGKVEL